jgi:hypothetical protein
MVAECFPVSVLPLADESVRARNIARTLRADVLYTPKGNDDDDNENGVTDERPGNASHVNACRTTASVTIKAM